MNNNAEDNETKKVVWWWHIIITKLSRKNVSGMSDVWDEKEIVWKQKLETKTQEETWAMSLMITSN